MSSLGEREEESADSVHVASKHACISFHFAFMLLLGLQSLELQKLPGKGNSLQGEATGPVPAVSEALQRHGTPRDGESLSPQGLRRGR